MLSNELSDYLKREREKREKVKLVIEPINVVELLDDITPVSQIDRMVEYEQGSLGMEAAVELFQELIDSGLVWSLQGFYGKVAYQLIDKGLCRPAKLPKEGV